MKRTAILCILIWSGCSEVKQELGLTIDLTGEVAVDGTEPADYDLALYAWGDNQAAFDESWCLGEPGCFGRVDVSALDQPAPVGKITWKGTAFTVADVPADLAYILRIEGADDAVDCSKDIVGFDEERKVVTEDSAIAIDPEAGLDVVELPRKARLSCQPPLTEPTPPDDPIPGEEPTVPDGTDPDGDITLPPSGDLGAAWTSFVVTAGSDVSDASTGDAISGLACDSGFPEKLTIQATSTDTTAEQAFLRIQFGTDADARVQTAEVPMNGGVVDQEIALTGGYAVIQLDLDGELNGTGESHTVTFCDRADPPAQELLAILTWDKDDTDVDLHIDSDHTEVAYYSMHQPWGDLDIDDIDGHGPETAAAAPGESGRDYTVWAHYYSDHGHGKTTATVRVVYVDPTTGETCDVSASKEIPANNWFRIGKFGPGLACP